jgi:hypothetical protein
MDQEMARAIGRLEGKLEAIHEDVVEIKDEVSQTNGRVTVLESRVDRQKGALAVLGALGAMVGSVLTLFFKGW